MRSCKGITSSSQGHDDHGAELQALGEVHRTDRDTAARRFDVLVEDFERQACSPSRTSGR